MNTKTNQSTDLLKDITYLSLYILNKQKWRDLSNSLLDAETGSA